MFAELFECRANNVAGRGFASLALRMAPRRRKRGACDNHADCNGNLNIAMRRLGRSPALTWPSFSQAFGRPGQQLTVVFGLEPLTS
jgi:hypothetical protein